MHLNKEKNYKTITKIANTLGEVVKYYNMKKLRVKRAVAISNLICGLV